MFNKIYKSLKWGGAFLMFEKVRANDARFQDMISQIYMDYKIKQGFKSIHFLFRTWRWNGQSFRKKYCNI